MLKILALDVATKTGWCHAEESGTWDFNPKRDESKGMRRVKFKAKVYDVINGEDIALVVFERTAGAHKNALIVQAELHGVLKELCERLNVDYKAYSAGEIKKFATGNGKATKQQMIQACIDNYNEDPCDDNEADAIHLYFLAKRDYSA